MAESGEPSVVGDVLLGHPCERRRLRGNADAAIVSGASQLGRPGRSHRRRLTRQSDKLMIAYAAKVSRGPVTTDERFVAGPLPRGVVGVEPSSRSDTAAQVVSEVALTG